MSEFYDLSLLKMASAHDIYQQVFGMSIIADEACNYNGTWYRLQSWLQSHLSGFLSDTNLKQWEVVWGPAIWKHDPDDASTGADNAWYIVRNTEAVFHDGSQHYTYTVVIAGTAMGYDWLGNDFVAGKVVDFDEWVDSGISSPPEIATDVDDKRNSYIGWAAACSTFTMLTCPAPEGTAGAGHTIPSFLQKHLQHSFARVIFTGHGLGGALASTLAHGMASSGMLQSAGAVLTYSTAAPTPGNALFADQVCTELPSIVAGPKAYQCWNTNVRNTLDVVPYAWSTGFPEQNLFNISSIWGTLCWPVDAYVDALVGAALALVAESGVAYTPLRESNFMGTAVEMPTTLDQFKLAAEQQHLAEYERFLGVSRPATMKSSQVAAEYGLTARSAIERADSRAALALGKLAERRRTQISF